VLNISKRFLIQDSAGVDEMLRRDILRAVEEQLEKTLLGSQTGLADNYPAGLASYYSTYTNITDWQDTV
jgi:hypothetical protein